MRLTAIPRWLQTCAVATFWLAAQTDTASAQGLPDEITSRMSSIPTFSAGQSGSAVAGSRSPAGSSFRPQGTTGRGLSRKDFFGEQLRASRGLSGMENQGALQATAARAASARQQLRLQQQRQLMALRQSQTATTFRDARQEMHHTLTLGFEPQLLALPADSAGPVRATHVEARLMAVAARLPIANLAIGLDGRKAILTGQAADEHVAKLAGRMVAMEPGVSQIENRLTVATP